MGIQPTVVTYLSDRGDTFDLASMKPSHLLNVINHHSTQVETMERMMDDKRFATEQALARLNGLKDTVMALQIELATRDPDEDSENNRQEYDSDRW